MNVGVGVARNFVWLKRMMLCVLSGWVGEGWEEAFRGHWAHFEWAGGGIVGFPECPIIPTTFVFVLYHNQHPLL